MLILFFPELLTGKCPIKYLQTRLSWQIIRLIRAVNGFLLELREITIFRENLIWFGNEGPRGEEKRDEKSFGKSLQILFLLWKNVDKFKRKEVEVLETLKKTFNPLDKLLSGKCLTIFHENSISYQLQSEKYISFAMPSTLQHL